MKLEYFHLIDRIVELDTTDSRIRVEANVPHSSTIFEGHFPGKPLMPGVLLIESMAQTSGWLLVALNHFEKMPFLAAVKDAKLRSFVPPGARLDITAGIAHEGSGFAITEAAIAIDGKKTCNATLTFSILPFPDDAFRDHMLATARQIEFPEQAMTHG